MNDKKEERYFATVVTPNSSACGESVCIEVGRRTLRTRWDRWSVVWWVGGRRDRPPS